MKLSSFIQNIKKSVVSEFQGLVLSRQEKALILTLMVLMLVVTGLLIFHLGNSPKEILIEIPSQYEIEKILQQEEEIFTDDKQPDLTDTEVTTKAYNQADVSLKQADNLKSLDELLAEQEKQGDNSEKIENIAPPINNELNNKENINTPPKLEPQQIDKNEVNKNALVKYSLEGRNATRELPNPIYTCENYGKIVVNIVVDMNGAIIEAIINTQQSTSTNACLIDNALSYANKARFSPDFNKPKQKGTITYIFQPKERK